MPTVVEQLEAAKAAKAAAVKAAADNRTAKLDWMRDGMKWVVGIATGLLGLSATYFYDRFDQAPRFAGLLYAAWVLLLICSLAGIFATLSTWKNIGSGAFGPWLTRSYTVAMWTFTFGFLFLAVVLIVNVGVVRKVNATADLFAVGAPLPEFDPASETPSDPRFALAACSIRQMLSDSGATSALVVGRFDERELTTGAQAHLAQRRADRIAALLTDSTLCGGHAIKTAVTLTGGPRQVLPPGIAPADADKLLREDRRVEVYGIHAKKS